MKKHVIWKKFFGEKIEDNRGSALKNLSGTNKSQSKIKLLETANGTSYAKQLIANELNRYFTKILQKREDRKDSDSVTFDHSKLSNFV